jgi:hypothetical protein
VEVDQLRPKDVVRLSFRLPVSGVTIEATGTVVWGNERRQGIQFSNLMTKTQQSIQRFMAEVDRIED